MADTNKKQQPVGPYTMGKATGKPASNSNLIEGKGDLRDSTNKAK